MPAQKTILLNANHLFVWHKKFGPAQNILGPVKGQGIHLFMPCSFTGPEMFWAGPNFLC